MKRSLAWLALTGIGAIALYRSMQAASVDSGNFDEEVVTMGALSSVPYNMIQLAKAIARAEGFYAGNTFVQSSSSLPGRANNPGDLKVGDVGYGTIGSDGNVGYASHAGITVFRTAEDGWQALYNQLTRIANRNSRYYTPAMSFADMALTWAGDADWGVNVARTVGASVDAAIGSYLS